MTIIKVRLDSQEYQDLYSQCKDIRRVGEYGYLMTDEQWQNIPFVNQVPSFNSEIEELNVEMFDDGNGLKRRWVVTLKSEEIPE